MRLPGGDLRRGLAGQPFGVAPVLIRVQAALETLGRTEDAAAVDGNDDMIAAWRGDDAFFGVRREPGVPDDIVEGCTGTRMQELRHGGDETVVAGIVERSAQRTRYVRLEENLRLHADLESGRPCPGHQRSADDGSGQRTRERSTAHGAGRHRSPTSCYGRRCARTEQIFNPLFLLDF